MTKKDNIINFPTDMAQAEAKIDRAHKRWLKVVRHEKNVKLSITAQSRINYSPEKSHRIYFPQCTWVDLEILFPKQGVSMLWKRKGKKCTN